MLSMDNKKWRIYKMALPSLLQQLVDRKLDNYCKNKIPEHVKNEIRLHFKIRGDHVTLFESRPYYLKPSEWIDKKVAQFRYDRNEKNWTLYCVDRNEKWHPYFKIEACENIDDLIKEVDEDPTGIFWG